MSKKIFLTLLLLGFLFGPVMIGEINAAAEAEPQGVVSIAQESIEKDVMPGWQQCFQTVKDLFVQAKNYIKSFDVNKAAGDIKGEFAREVEALKKDIPEAFKGAAEWYRLFSENWLKKP